MRVNKLFFFFFFFFSTNPTFIKKNWGLEGAYLIFYPKHTLCVLVRIRLKFSIFASEKKCISKFSYDKISEDQNYLNLHVYVTVTMPKPEIH